MLKKAIVFAFFVLLSSPKKTINDEFLDFSGFPEDCDDEFTQVEHGFYDSCNNFHESIQVSNLSHLCYSFKADDYVFTYDKILYDYFTYENVTNYNPYAIIFNYARSWEFSQEIQEKYGNNKKFTPTSEIPKENISLPFLTNKNFNPPREVMEKCKGTLPFTNLGYAQLFLIKQLQGLLTSKYMRYAKYSYCGCRIITIKELCGALCTWQNGQCVDDVIAELFTTFFQQLTDFTVKVFAEFKILKCSDMNHPVPCTLTKFPPFAQCHWCNGECADAECSDYGMVDCMYSYKCTPNADGDRCEDCVKKYKLINCFVQSSFSVMITPAFLLVIIILI